MALLEHDFSIKIFDFQGQGSRKEVSEFANVRSIY